MISDLTLAQVDSIGDNHQAFDIAASPEAALIMIAKQTTIKS